MLCRFWNLKPGIWNLEFETWNLKLPVQQPDKQLGHYHWLEGQESSLVVISRHFIASYALATFGT